MSLIEMTTTTGCQHDPAWFGRLAPKLVDNGYSVVAVLPDTKRPRHPKWQAACFRPTDEGYLHRHAAKQPNDSVGIACGRNVVAIDIDQDDPTKAHDLYRLACTILGDTPLVRVGKFPRRMLIYRPADHINVMHAAGLDVIGHGGFFVAFGFHADTGQPYYWPESDPIFSVPEELPLIGATDIQRFLGQASASIPRVIVPVAVNDNDPPQKSAVGAVRSRRESARIVRDDCGRVVDGREELLRDIVYEEYRNGYGTAQALADRAWFRFAAEADLVRPKGGGKKRWCRGDVLSKAKAICAKRMFHKQRGRARADQHPASHLHRFRRPGYWRDDQKARHQAEARCRATTPSVLIVNEHMLELTPAEMGQCRATIKTLAKRTGLSESAVKVARRKLCKELGLWVAERAVYLPVPVWEAQSIHAAAENSRRVQEQQHPLSRRVESPCLCQHPFNEDNSRAKAA
jgi:hypothetical protein